MGTVEAVQEERHPSGSSFEKADAEPGKPLEDPVGDHRGGLDHDAHGMPDGVDRIVGAEGVHAQVVQGAHVHGQGAVELLGLLVDGPVELRSQVVLQALSVGGQHGSDHSLLRDGAAQLLHGGIHVLDRDQRHPLELRAVVEEGIVEPVVVGAAGGDGPFHRDEPAHGQTPGGIEHRPVDSRLLQELQPFLRAGIAELLLPEGGLQVVEVEVVEHRKGLPRPATLRHVLHQLLVPRQLVHVTVAIDDLHGKPPLTALLQLYTILSTKL